MSNDMNNETRYFSLNKKIVGYKTYESWTTVPHVTFIYEADATGLLDEFYRLKEKVGGALTINTLLLRICVEAIKAAPQVNAHIKYNRRLVTGRLDVKREIDISAPWLLENGDMVTINLRSFEAKTLTQMQEYIDKTALKIKNCDIYIPMYQVSVNNMLGEIKRGRLFKAAGALLGAAFGKSRTRRYDRREVGAYNRIPAEDKITERDLEPGTVTISNLGSVYRAQKGFMGILEIIPPQVFAIGVGGIQEKPGITAGRDGKKEIAVRKIIPMCLAFDHRALNFNELVPFMEKLDQIFEHPEVLSLWL